MSKKNWVLHLPAILLALFFILAGILTSLNRFWQYETFFYDFGIFDQAIWKVAHFQPPIIEHLVVGEKWIFADHFNPSIFLLSPFYWLTPRSEMLLIIQVITVGVSGYILYLIGTEILKNRFMSFGVMCCYFLFIGMQNAVISDFHEVTVAVLPLMLLYLMIIKGRLKLYYLFLFLTLGFKESNSILGIGIGVSLLLINKKWIKIGLLTCLISIIWGLISIKMIIPYFSGGNYQYTESLSLDFQMIILNFITNLPIKLHTFFYSLLSFGFLPLLAPPFWFLILQDFLTRFYSPYSLTRIGLGLHYSALLAVIMSVSSIFGLKFIKNKVKKKNLLNLLIVLLIINAFVLYRFVLRGPFGLSYNPAFYKHTDNFIFLNKIIEKVPKKASIMTQNNLAVRFTHQPVWLLRSEYRLINPDYILIDIRSGQNPNNFFGERNFNVYKFLDKLKKDPCYKIKYSTDNQYLFERIISISNCAKNG